MLLQLKRVLGLWVAVACLAATGCVSRLGDLSVASTQAAELDRVDLDAMPTRRNVEGEDIKFILLFIPFGRPHLETAIEDALDRGNGDVMTDVTIESVGWWFLVGQSGFRVRGDVIDSRGRTLQSQAGGS